MNVKNVTVDELYENADKYTCYCPAGFEPLSPNGEYLIYASYNEDEKCYYPTYYFYGIFNSTDGKKYTRYKIEEDDIYSGTTIEKIENCIKLNK